VLYDRQSGIAAMQLWQDIYNDIDLKFFTTDYDVAFASHHLAMAMDGPWNLPRFKGLLKDVRWAIGPLPAGPARRATIVGGEYLAIFKQSKHPQQAWQFVKWLASPEVQARWSMKSAYLPIRRAVHKIPEFQKYLAENPNFKAYVDEMENGMAQSPIDYYGLEIGRHISEAIEKVTVGHMDPATALSEAAAKSNQLLRSVQK
jgi:ABC-type glycerol-3-phosphate transport system substrate-binding protein